MQFRFKDYILGFVSLCLFNDYSKLPQQQFFQLNDALRGLTLFFTLNKKTKTKSMTKIKMEHSSLNSQFHRYDLCFLRSVVVNLVIVSLARIQACHCFQYFPFPVTILSCAQHKTCSAIRTRERGKELLFNDVMYIQRFLNGIF